MNEEPTGRCSASDRTRLATRRSDANSPTATGSGHPCQARPIARASSLRLRILPLWARRTKSLDALLPSLYLRGISTGHFQGVRWLAAVPDLRSGDLYRNAARCPMMTSALKWMLPRVLPRTHSGGIYKAARQTALCDRLWLLWKIPLRNMLSSPVYRQNHAQYVRQTTVGGCDDAKDAFYEVLSSNARRR